MKRHFGEGNEEESEQETNKRQTVMSRRACIRVPSQKNKLERALYDKLHGEGKREAWVDHVLGPHGVYVGRPKNDGGWYQVERIKRGSFLANPFPVKDYGIEKSLSLYEAYIRLRLSTDSTMEQIIALLPAKERNAAIQFYSAEDEKTNQGRGKSARHLELNILGNSFRERLLHVGDKHGKLGCFCDLTDPCHVDVLLKIMDETSPLRDKLQFG